jgi:hypothetical protein
VTLPLIGRSERGSHGGTLRMMCWEIFWTMSRMIAIGWGCWSIRDFPFDTWRLSVVDALSVCDHIDFSWMSDFRVGLVDIFYTRPLTVFDQLHFRSDMRRYVEVYMSWLGRFSFSLPRIESGREIAAWDFTEIHWQDMILDSGDDSLRHYSLGLQEWRMQSRQEGQIFMIRVVQHQHDGSFPGDSMGPWDFMG